MRDILGCLKYVWYLFLFALIFVTIEKGCDCFFVKTHNYVDFSYFTSKSGFFVDGKIVPKLHAPEAILVNSANSKICDLTTYWYSNDLYYFIIPMELQDSLGSKLQNDSTYFIAFEIYTNRVRPNPGYFRGYTHEKSGNYEIKVPVQYLKNIDFNNKKITQYFNKLQEKSNNRTNLCQSLAQKYEPHSLMKFKTFFISQLKLLFLRGSLTDKMNIRQTLKDCIGCKNQNCEMFLEGDAYYECNLESLGLGMLLYKQIEHIAKKNDIKYDNTIINTDIFNMSANDLQNFYTLETLYFLTYSSDELTYKLNRDTLIISTKPTYDTPQ